TGLATAIALAPASRAGAASGAGAAQSAAAVSSRAVCAASSMKPYDPRAAFAPLNLPEPVNRYRSADGAPGPDYWQNRADYRIAARLDPATRTLTGEEVISYTNNSPDALDVLWLQLDQNTYRPDSRSGAVGGRPRQGFTQGDVLDAVEIESAGRFIPASTLVSDTRLLVRLPTPLPPSGGRVRLRIRYHYEVPSAAFGGRTGWMASKNGPIFDIAQWFPRLAVYDDVRGWDPLPYLGQEFYLEVGTIDYAVTVPADMVVVGSGALMNPKEVLSPIEQARLAKARMSEKTVMIRTAPEAASALPAASLRTWRFHMDETRDVAFAASKAFIWDAARVDLPDGRTALAQSVYPMEATSGANNWSRSTSYLKFAIEDFSRRWYPYPWPNAINVAGPVEAMEYPALVFDGVADRGKQLFYLTVHEIGHTYFPMIVGSDERRWAWMDEGLNT
ncbi:MAG: M1 family metallopeptidase, partial [Caulobacteraceae bacterium]